MTHAHNYAEYVEPTVTGGELWGCTGCDATVHLEGPL